MTFICNAIQGVKIVPSNDFEEAVTDYVKGLHLDSEEEENNEIETIMFNSVVM